jgi:heme A synthase
MPEYLTLYTFLSGAVAFGYFVCALFFLRFWNRVRDELFVSFALAFTLLGGVQAALAIASIPTENRAWVYLVRLLAFAIILVAIYRKNRASA